MTEPGGGFPLPTDSAHVRIESRQYNLFRLDLGEGVPRVAMKVSAAVFPPWLLLCFLLGVPIFSGLLIWIGPPLFVVGRGVTRDEGGRLRIRSWADRVAWLASRHRPIVNAGQTSSAPPQPIATSLTFTVVDLDDLPLGKEGSSAQQDAEVA